MMNLQLYQKILDGLLIRKPYIPFGSTAPMEVNNIIQAILNDNPHLFWFEGKWKVGKVNGVNCMIPQYLYTSAEIEEGQKVIDKWVAEVRQFEKESPLEKARMVYDKLLKEVTYGKVETEGQNIYDALVKKAAVCKGLSKAYQFLVGKLGVESVLADGTIDGVARHVWNVIRIEDKHYHVDVSMGYEIFDYLFAGEDEHNPYRCFAVSDLKLQKTHKMIRIYRRWGNA